MALFDICSYKDQATYGAAVGALDDGGTITGHHIIPDHCFYYTSGLRGMGDLSAFLCPGVKGYKTDDAPVIIVTADANAGKSRVHGLIHQVFDAIELAAAKKNGNQWKYSEARDAAIQSVTGNCAKYSAAGLKKILDDYFIVGCGLTDDTLVRAGEHGTMTSAPPPRRSDRGGSGGAMRTAKGTYRHNPYG